MDVDLGSVSVLITALVAAGISIATFRRVGATERRNEEREAEKLKRERERLERETSDRAILLDMKTKVDGLGDKREASGLRTGLAEGEIIGQVKERNDPQISASVKEDKP